MTDFDDKLRRALAQPLDPADDILTVRGLITETFRHRNRLVVVAGMLKMLAFVVLMVVALVFTLSAEDERSRFLWGIGFLAATVSVAFMGTFHWMLLSRNATTRELKRIELQLAELRRELGHGG